MNITYLIGNGFDINIGLKTKYSDFYPYFLKNGAENNLIKKWIKEDFDNENIKLWSDLEFRIGELTSKIKNDEEVKLFNDSILEMAACLNDYLLDENKRFLVHEKQELIKKEFSNSLQSFKNNGSQSDINKINILINRLSDKDFYFNFLVFNYTDVLDKIISLYGNNNVISNHSYNGNTYKDIIRSVMHVHGTLDRGMIIGVNDEGQIKSELLKKNNIYADSLIKDKLNENLGDRNIENASNIINNSHVIVTYGLSIGQTDKNWWKKLIKWVSVADSHYLIINYYDVNFNERISQYFVQERELIINELKKVTEIDSFDGFNDRILLYLNKNAFNFKFLLKDK